MPKIVGVTWPRPQIYSQFAPLPICPSNQLAPLKYRASCYPALPAKLLAAIY